MQYILTEKEYGSLDEIRYYDNLLASTKIAAETVMKAVCIRPIGKYCDGCPIAHLDQGEIL